MSTIEPAVTLDIGTEKNYLQELESISRQNNPNFAQSNTMQVFQVKGSVFPKTIGPTIIMTLWATLWVILFKSIDALKPLQIPTALIPILSIVVVFRTNTAYDRFWEARKLWSNLITHSRNLSRNIWIDINNTKDQTQQEAKKGALDLLLAYVIACKHYLRYHKGINYIDLYYLLKRIPEFKKNEQENNVPFQIIFHISAYLTKTHRLGLSEGPLYANMLASLNQMTSCLSECERIRDSPVPMAYNIHLKQTLVLYLVSLPFQLVNTCNWATIPIVAIGSFILYGVENIGHEIENPFGYDENDLKLDEFVDKLKMEFLQIRGMAPTLDCKNWTVPAEL